MSHSFHCVQQEGRLASKVVKPDLLPKMAANANEQVLRPSAAEQVALAVAEAAGIRPEQPEGQVPVQQVVNAPNDGGGRANVPALEVSCFISFCVFKFPLLAGFRFLVLCRVAINCSFCLRLCGGQFAFFFLYACVVLNCVFYFRLWGDKFIPVWRQVCDFMPAV